MIDFVGVAWAWSMLSELLAYPNGSKFPLGQRGLDNRDWTVRTTCCISINLIYSAEGLAPMVFIPCRISMALMLVKKVMECARAIRSYCQLLCEQSNHIATTQVCLLYILI